MFALHLSAIALVLPTFGSCSSKSPVKRYSIVLLKIFCRRKRGLDSIISKLKQSAPEKQSDEQSTKLVNSNFIQVSVLGLGNVPGDVVIMENGQVICCDHTTDRCQVV